MRNVLDSHSSTERAEFLSLLSGLSDDFETHVYSKQRPHNYGESPEYIPVKTFRSNSITEKEIQEMFSISDSIRGHGIQWKDERGLPHNPEVPSLDLACAKFGRDPEIFRTKLEQLRPLYLASLKIKTDPELRKAKKEDIERHSGASQRSVKFLCTSCNIEYTKEAYAHSRFCHKCHNRISVDRG